MDVSLCIVNFPSADWRAEVVEQEQVIGRGKEAEIRVPDRFVSISRRHSAIWKEKAGRLMIRDVGSRLGTSVNGVPLPPETPFQFSLGDRICLGAVELRVIATLLIPTRQTEESETWEGDGTHFDPRIELAGLFQELSPAELEVVLWLCRGYSRLESISKKLYRSGNTVRTQLNSIFRKLRVHSREELTGMVRRGGRFDS